MHFQAKQCDAYADVANILGHFRLENNAFNAFSYFLPHMHLGSSILWVLNSRVFSSNVKIIFLHRFDYFFYSFSAKQTEVLSGATHFFADGSEGDLF